MLNEWSDREPDPDERRWITWAITGLSVVATLAFLAQLATCVAG